LQITEEQNRAAGDFVDLIAGQLGAGRAIHPETAIAASARISGSLLLRSFGFDLESQEPGTVLLSNEANEKGPNLVNLLGALLAKNKVELNSTKLGGASVHRGAEPKLSTQQSLALLQTFPVTTTSRRGRRFGYWLHRQRMRYIYWRRGWLQCCSFRIR
jgi:hypothetical protein